MKSPSGMVSRSSCASRASRPLRQVAMTKNNSAPTTNGAQPPSKIFMRLADTNERSTSAKLPASSALGNELQPHSSRIAAKASPDVNNMVSETATPNAAARLSEDRKPSASDTVAAMRSQLTGPM